MKIGDKVKMTRRGFNFYSNLDKIFDCHSHKRTLNERQFESAVCGLFSVNGVGTVKHFNSEGNPYVRWEFSLNGMYYFHEHYFDKRDVRKLTLLERIYYVCF